MWLRVIPVKVKPDMEAGRINHAEARRTQRKKNEECGIRSEE